MPVKENGPLTDYWLTHYVHDACTLCGNRGIIDTRGVTTPAGIPVGRLNYCICPNGQSLRAQNAPMKDWTK